MFHSVATGKKTSSGTIAGIVIGILILLVIVGAVALVVYSYKNPTSTTGQMLIKVSHYDGYLMAVSQCSKWEYTRVYGVYLYT